MHLFYDIWIGITLLVFLSLIRMGQLDDRMLCVCEEGEGDSLDSWAISFVHWSLVCSQGFGSGDFVFSHRIKGLADYNQKNAEVQDESLKNWIVSGWLHKMALCGGNFWCNRLLFYYGESCTSFFFLGDHKSSLKGIGIKNMSYMKPAFIFK